MRPSTAYGRRRRDGPEDGRILAMVSTPGFDANLMATHDADAANATYDQLVADDRRWKI